MPQPSSKSLLVRPTDSFPLRIRKPGFDQRDATSANLPVPDYISNLKEAKDLSQKPLEGKRIGLVTETMGEGVDPHILTTLIRTADHMRDLGAEVTEV